MTGSDRLNAVQATLAARGVSDVKLTYGPGICQAPVEDVRHGVADFLEAYVDGRGVVVKELVDA